MEYETNICVTIYIFQIQQYSLAKKILEYLYVHISPLTLTMLSLTAHNISSDSLHYNFWHLMKEIAESSIGFKLLLSHTINCSLCKNVTYKNPDMSLSWSIHPVPANKHINLISEV